MAGGTAPIAIGRVVLARVYFRKEMFHCPLFGIVPKKQIRANSQNEKNDTGKNNRFYDADTTLVSRTILLQIAAHQVPSTSLTRSAYLLRRIRLVVSGSCVSGNIVCRLVLERKSDIDHDIDASRFG